MTKCCFANHRTLVPSDDEIIFMPCNGAQSAVINWHVTPCRRFVAFAANERAEHEQLPLTLTDTQSEAQIEVTQGCVFFSRFIKNVGQQ